MKLELDRIYNCVRGEKLHRSVGRVSEAGGLLVESIGPRCCIGDIVQIADNLAKKSIDAEVIGFRGERVMLMPLGEHEKISYGSKVILSGARNAIPVGVELVGRVIDAMGNAVDGKGPIFSERRKNFKYSVPEAIKRPMIDRSFETSIKAIDTFTPIGVGQRMGIFAGSGVGKSTLLGMLARGSEADINVLALIGERGRELNEFIVNDLGEDGLAKSIVVVATSDQAAPLRVRAAFLATYIAEFFRDLGKNVLLMMDSVTRFAMAQREIGLSLGEPPATRGYPPSVFGLLPKLLERSGRDEKGDITAFYTVLVEGDDFNEPISDATRGILDGHIILSRAIATANQFPAIDVLESISRLARQVTSKEDYALISLARNMLSIYRKNEDLITVGAYKPGHNAQLDKAVSKYEALRQFLIQPYDDRVSKQCSFDRLREILL